MDRTRCLIRLRPVFAGPRPRSRAAAIVGSAGLAVVACLAGGTTPSRAATPARGATRAQTVTVSPADPRLQLLGRWNRDTAADTTVNSGSRLLLRFTGSSVTALFDTSSITNPPQFYARIDSGIRLGGDARALAPPPAPARQVLFLGDSITQGERAVGPQLSPDGADATKDYAWLAGNALHSDFQQAGFGAQGITHGGNGKDRAVQSMCPR